MQKASCVQIIFSYVHEGTKGWEPHEPQVQDGKAPLLLAPRASRCPALVRSQPSVPTLQRSSLELGRRDSRRRDGTWHTHLASWLALVQEKQSIQEKQSLYPPCSPARSSPQALKPFPSTALSSLRALVLRLVSVSAVRGPSSSPSSLMCPPFSISHPPSSIMNRRHD